jgi:hypothetical protein
MADHYFKCVCKLEHQANNNIQIDSLFHSNSIVSMSLGLERLRYIEVFYNVIYT